MTALIELETTSTPAEREGTLRVVRLLAPALDLARAEEMARAGWGWSRIRGELLARSKARDPERYERVRGEATPQALLDRSVNSLFGGPR